MLTPWPHSPRSPRTGHPVPDWHKLIAGFLPWFDPVVEQRRDKHTEAIRRRSIAGRKRAERVIDEYRLAARASNAAGERVIDEMRRADDER